MLLGALGGVGLRIGFTLVIVQLLGVPLLKTLGALLLLGVAIKLPINEAGHARREGQTQSLGRGDVDHRRRRGDVARQCARHRRRRAWLDAPNRVRAGAVGAAGDV